MAMSLRHESIGTCTSTIELVYDDSNSTCGQRFGHQLTADGEESLRTLLAPMHAERHCCARTAAFGVRCACLHHWSPWIALERTQQAALAMSTMLAVLRIIWLELAASMLLVCVMCENDRTVVCTLRPDISRIGIRYYMTTLLSHGRSTGVRSRASAKRR